MKILIVGGTGLISSELAAQAHAHSHQLTLINRGTSKIASPPPGADVIHADATNATAMRAALRGRQLRGEKYDAVVQFVAFTPEHVAEDVETFSRLTDQYVLIATGAAYETREHFVALTENTPQENLHWEYARLKQAAEQVLRERATATGLGWTIARPAHTYGPSKIPAFTGNSSHPWTIVDRMRRGADIVIPGDGTGLWTITHARDVAVGLLGLLGNPNALGQAVHITSDQALTWTGLYRTIAHAAGLSDEQFEAQRVYVPSDALVAAAPSQSGSIYGDKMHPAVYDNSLIKALVPGWSATTTFAEGMAQAIEWGDADPARQSVDAAANAMFDRLGAIYRGALSAAAAPDSGN